MNTLIVVSSEPKECKIINEVISSKNSLTARSGFKAEFRTDNTIKIALEKYFKSNIVSMEKNMTH